MLDTVVETLIYKISGITKADAKKRKKVTLQAWRGGLARNGRATPRMLAFQNPSNFQGKLGQVTGGAKYFVICRVRRDLDNNRRDLDNTRRYFDNVRRDLDNTAK